MFEFTRNPKYVLFVGLLNSGLAVFNLSTATDLSWLGWINMALGATFISFYLLLEALGKDDGGGSGGKPKPSSDDGKETEVIV